MGQQRLYVILLIALVCIVGGVKAGGQFKNPLIKTGPDPWMAQKDGFYYFMVTRQTNLTIWKTKDPTDIKNAEEHVIWLPPAKGNFSKEIWAPELHYVKGSWYVYFSADDGDNNHHRVYVLQNQDNDPTTDRWEFKGKLQLDTEDNWGIDMTAFEHNDKWYAVWSGWLEDSNSTQVLYINEMDTPKTTKSNRVLISKPTYEWERITNDDEIYVNEGPEMLKHEDKLFIVYSASYCQTNNYSLGLLVAKNTSDLMDPNSWTKYEKPVFENYPEAQAYGIGHNTFFVSPDGKEHWIVYHGNPESGQGCYENRSSRAQPFTWKEDGFPNFGRPVPLKEWINKPSGVDTSFQLNQIDSEGIAGKILFIVLIFSAFVYYFACYKKKTKKVPSRIQ